MEAGTEATGGEVRDAAAVYAAEDVGIEAAQARAGKRARLLGVLKLMVAAGTVIAAAVLLRTPAKLGWLALPVALFIVLEAAHEKVLGAMRRRDRALRFYRRRMARLEGRWAGAGENGARFLDAAHPYARDLDVFGEQSLFEYLNSARTRAGEARLARWLLEAAPVEEILARQEAVRELAPKLKLREELASCGEDVRAGVDAEAMAAWGESSPLLMSLETRAATTVLCLLWLASLAAWPVFGTWMPLALMSVANVAYAHRIHLRWAQAAEAIEKAGEELRLLAEVLVLLEREKFRAEKLRELEEKTQGDGRAASAAIRSLARLADMIAGRHNKIGQWFDPVLFWSAQFVFVAERWQKRHGAAIRVWLEAAGELEALASLAAIAFEHPEYGFAEVAGEGPLFEAEGLAHPLLLAGKAVGNDVCLDGQAQVMILSGPNMAGKSTFIRSIGVNAVLAQCGAPVCARRVRMSPLRVAASICVLDSLTGGVSRFYAEIRRVKTIAELAGGRVPVLFLLDELLSGTNSHDRLKGTEFVLRMLAERRAIGVVSTHDLALTRIPETMGGRAFNAHFQDQFAGDALTFDYTLRPGPVETSNALRLMRAIGLGVAEEGSGDARAAEGGADPRK